MRGFVETPKDVVDLMVSKLFRDAPPTEQSRVLDAGAGRGAFIDGIIRWCQENEARIPQIVAVELNPKHALFLRERYKQYPSVSIKEEDFLTSDGVSHTHVIGNPPFIPITELGQEEKRVYRATYKTAIGRFDLYLLFFERALNALKPNGRLVFITPEKFLYVETAKPLRKMLSTKQVEEIQLVDENTFGDLVTYPVITTVVNKPGPVKTSVIHRGGKLREVTFPLDGSSWWPSFTSGIACAGDHMLGEICERISPGVATGADGVFVVEPNKVRREMKPFAYPTIAGRELGPANNNLKTRTSMLTPYDRKGKLIDLNDLGALMDYLVQKDIQARLKKRTCVKRKPWYAFHENPPLPDILRPKILCKDITKEPHFWIDHEGRIVPRHTVYYMVPRDPEQIGQIAQYLNSDEARGWLRANCQRAANGFLRIQSHVLRRLPIPERLLSKDTSQGSR